MEVQPETLEERLPNASETHPVPWKLSQLLCIDHTWISLPSIDHSMIHPHFPAQQHSRLASSDDIIIIMAHPTSNERSTPHPALQIFVQPSPAPRNAQPKPQPSRTTLQNIKPPMQSQRGRPSQTLSKQPVLPRSIPSKSSLDASLVRPPSVVSPPSISPLAATGALDTGVQNNKPFNLFKDVFPRIRQML